MFLNTPQDLEDFKIGTPLNSTSPLACSEATLKSGAITSIIFPEDGDATDKASSPNLTAYKEVFPVALSIAIVSFATVSPLGRYFSLHELTYL